MKAMGLEGCNSQKNNAGSGIAKRGQKYPSIYFCNLCPRHFTRAYNLRSHVRTHTEDRPFACAVCQRAFVRRYDRKRHERLHYKVKTYLCQGDIKAGVQWGCGRTYTRRDALNRHLRSEAGRACVDPFADKRANGQQHQDLVNPPENTQLCCEAEGTSTLSLPATTLDYYPTSTQMASPMEILSENMDEGQLGCSPWLKGTDYDFDVEPIMSAGCVYSTWWAAYVHAMKNSGISEAAVGNVGYLDIRSPVLATQADVPESSARNTLWCEAEGTNDLSIPALEHHPTPSRITPAMEVFSESMGDAQLISSPLLKESGYNIDLEPMAGPAYSTWWTAYVYAMTKPSTSIASVGNVECIGVIPTVSAMQEAHPENSAIRSAPSPCDRQRGGSRQVPQAWAAGQAAQYWQHSSNEHSSL